MAYDAQLVLYDAANSGSVFTSANVELAATTKTTDAILLPGVPLRGLNLNVVLPVAQSTPSMVLTLLEGASTGAAHYPFRTYPVPITAAGEYNMRFHLDKGYPSLKARWTISSGISGGGFGASAIIRIGMDRGAYGNG